jgi:hypothetical protein
MVSVVAQVATEEAPDYTPHLLRERCAKLCESSADSHFIRAKQHWETSGKLGPVLLVRKKRQKNLNILIVSSTDSLTMTVASLLGGRGNR